MLTPLQPTTFPLSIEEAYRCPPGINTSIKNQPVYIYNWNFGGGLKREKNQKKKSERNRAKKKTKRSKRNPFFFSSFFFGALGV